MTTNDCFRLLIYSMVESPSWEASWFTASQEIPRISRNPKVHYRTYKHPAPVSILGQPNPVHIPTSHLLEVRPNIIHPSTPRSPQWSTSLPTKTLYTSLSSPTRATCPAHLILLHFITRTMLHIYLRAQNINAQFLISIWQLGQYLSRKKMQHNYSKKMICGRTNPIRIIGGPDKQRRAG